MTPMARPPLARKSLALVAAYALALNAAFLAYAPFMPAGAEQLAPCAPSGNPTQRQDQPPSSNHFGCAICPLAHGVPLTPSGATLVLLAAASVCLSLPRQPTARPPSKTRLPVARGPPLAA